MNILLIIEYMGLGLCVLIGVAALAAGIFGLIGVTCEQAEKGNYWLIIVWILAFSWFLGYAFVH